MRDDHAEIDATSGTGARILDVAERLVQVRGFNGFSYADIATELAMTKAGLHYHFPSKAELGEALIRRYTTRFSRDLEVIDSTVADGPDKLRAYARLYEGVLRDDRMCLCGILAAEYRTLPGPMQHAVTRFFEVNELWLEDVLDAGRAAGTLSFTGQARGAARLLVAGLEGAMLLAHAFGDSAGFDAAAARLVAALSNGAS